MAYAITQGCCNDASCVAVCPVNCIHPTPDEPDFGTTSMLYVNPAVCIDCGACADACPVDAVFPADRLVGSNAVYVDINRDFYARRQQFDAPELTFITALPSSVEHLRVAVVGSGPAAHYATDVLLRIAGAEVTMIDKLPVTGGLLRYGVAPDHPATRRLADRFQGFLHNPRLSMLLGVEIGRDVSVAELAESFDAVVYAVGAATGRRLGIPGEDLPGSLTATEFVAWYNAHPDAGEPPSAFASDRAVIVGNGNVALDVARIMVGDTDHLATTDIADRALTALRASSVREVVIAARRGPDDAAYTEGEILALRHLPGVDLVVADGPGVREAIDAAAPGERAGFLRGVRVEPVDLAAAPPPGRRIVLLFDAVSSAIDGRDAVEEIAFARRDQEPVTVATGLVVRAIGYQGRELTGLPFDPATATAPNDRGRVVDPATGRVVPGAYVVGWFKRGASGGIGANRHDAAETVEALLADAAAHRLPRPRRSARSFRAMVRDRVPDVVDRKGLLAIDRAERQAGRAAGRPRVRYATIPELVAASRPARRAERDRSDVS